MHNHAADQAPPVAQLPPRRKPGHVVSGRSSLYAQVRGSGYGQPRVSTSTVAAAPSTASAAVQSARSQSTARVTAGTRIDNARAQLPVSARPVTSHSGRPAASVAGPSLSRRSSIESSAATLQSQARAAAREALAVAEAAAAAEEAERAAAEAARLEEQQELHEQLLQKLRELRSKSRALQSEASEEALTAETAESDALAARVEYEEARNQSVSMLREREALQSRIAQLQSEAAEIRSKNDAAATAAAIKGVRIAAAQSRAKAMERELQEILQHSAAIADEVLPELEKDAAAARSLAEEVPLLKRHLALSQRGQLSSAPRQAALQAREDRSKESATIKDLTFEVAALEARKGELSKTVVQLREAGNGMSMVARDAAEHIAAAIAELEELREERARLTAAGYGLPSLEHSHSRAAPSSAGVGAALGGVPVQAQPGYVYGHSQAQPQLLRPWAPSPAIAGPMGAGGSRIPLDPVSSYLSTQPGELIASVVPTGIADVVERSSGGTIHGYAAATVAPSAAGAARAGGGGGGGLSGAALVRSVLAGPAQHLMSPAGRKGRSNASVAESGVNGPGGGSSRVVASGRGPAAPASAPSVVSTQNSNDGTNSLLPAASATAAVATPLHNNAGRTLGAAERVVHGLSASGLSSGAGGQLAALLAVADAVLQDSAARPAAP